MLCLAGALLAHLAADRLFLERKCLRASMRKGIKSVLLLALAPLLLHAQGFWVKKSHEQWSAKECAKLLRDSPWAKSRTISAVLITPIGQPSATPGRESNPELTYAVQLLSALPVRQAMIRQTRLSADFAKLSADARQTLEARQAKLLAEEFKNHIVVRVEYSTNVPSYAQDMARYWQTRPLPMWQQDTFLVTSSGRISLVDVWVAGGAGGLFELTFPRMVNGQPVVRDTDKSFSLEFQSPAFGPIQGERVLLEFKLKDMALDGRLIF